MEYYFTYFVVFKSSGCNTNGPIILYDHPESIKKANNGTMHLLDDDLNGTLDAIEYIMHLPRNVFDVFDLDEEIMAASHDTPHHIILIPDSMILTFRIDATPALFILANSCDKQTVCECKKQNPLLGAYYVHELNEELVKVQWNQLWQHSKTDKVTVVNDINTHCWLKTEKLKALPVLFTNRQFGNTNELLSRIFNCTDIDKECLSIQWENASRLNALVLMRRKGITSWDENLYKETLIEEAKKPNVSVVVTFPGVSKLQIKHGPNAPVLSANERRAIRILGVHRAIARGGVVMEVQCANEQLFQKYDELEQRCKEGTNNKYIWKSLADLGKLLESCFSSFQIGMLKRAKDITVFSDFPIGLAILEDDEVPLQCYKKISYRPLTPLTRQLQAELPKCRQIYLGKKCKVAMAECVIDNKENRYVYPMCELVHRSLMDMEQNYSGLSLVYKQTYSVDSIIKFIEENKDADILYISAHGYYQREKNVAGIMVGNEFWMASEDINVPPIVILSACHVSPRGMGAVSIADMFIRNGAITVLGTFIPVSANKNLILMTRLFIYILEAQHGSMQYKTLDEAWSGIVASNAIHELMLASKSFGQWMHAKNSRGKERIIEFQLERCVGRLRVTHIYSDTIKIVKEMLLEEGMAGKFGDILDVNNYLPESFFYQLIGNPENIFLYNDIFKKLN